MSDLVKYWPVAVFVLNVVAAWACWSLRQLAVAAISAVKEKLLAEIAKVAGNVDEHDTRLTKLDSRVGHVEGQVQNLPTKADIERLQGAVNSVGQEVEAASAGIKRIEGFFLAKGVERI